MKQYEVAQMDKDGEVIDIQFVQAPDVWEATGLVILDHTRYSVTEWISVQIRDEEDA